MDKVLGMENCFSLGFSCHSGYPELLGPGSFGYVGAGGSMGFSDPASEVGFAYVMDQMRTGIIGDERAGALLKALRTCLSASG
jgi:CubicO group peptidase (beta-lactamase class C family)